MNNKVLIVSFAALALTGISLTIVGKTHARGGPGGYAMSFEALDANSDGMLTPEELLAHRAEKFAEADTDGDGFLSAEELASHAQSRMEKRMRQMIEHRDDDNDGMLSAKEMGPPQGRENRMFGILDADEDGMLTQEEFDAARHAFRGRGHGHSGGSHWQ